MDRALIISCDGHAGAPREQYRDYVDPRFRTDFDEDLAGHRRTLEQLRMAKLEIAKRRGDMEVAASSAFLADERIARGQRGAWDFAIRREELDAEGIAAEVLFPDASNDNAPPFGAASVSLHRAWTSQHRFEGARAFNRWAADFCSTDPVRMVGLALLPTYDVPAMVEEVRASHRAGLRGVIIDTPTDETRVYCEPRFDPLWAACEELGMVLQIHQGTVPEFGNSANTPCLIDIEKGFWFSRVLWLMIIGGVFQKFPGLRLGLAEQGIDRVPADLERMTWSFERHRDRSRLRATPREFFASNCMVCASFASQPELERRREIGVDNVTWGADYPHLEGAWPGVLDHLIDAFAGIPDPDRRKILGDNAILFYGLDRERLSDVAAKIGPTTASLDGGHHRPHTYSELEFAQGRVAEDEMERRTRERAAIG